MTTILLININIGILGNLVAFVNARKVGSVAGKSGLYHNNYTDFVIGMDNQGLGKYEEFCIDDLYIYEGLIPEKELKNMLSQLLQEDDKVGKFAQFCHLNIKFILKKPL